MLHHNIRTVVNLVGVALVAAAAAWAAIVTVW
jgi:hypothetical protein